MVYAGDHGGCMQCDSLAYELAANGHRPGCHSPYAHEPPRPPPPPLELARRLRDEAQGLRTQAEKLEAEANRVESSGA